jgi:ADP-ribosyl-[dinitrogen reductase] hydrolase
MNETFDKRCAGLAWGAFIGDALAMPVHWYYNRNALHRDYGVVRDYLAPRNPHPDSVLGRSRYKALNARGEILHEQAQYWGKDGIHYHQFLNAGENTLNLQLAKVLVDSLIAQNGYDADDYLRRYVDFMLSPGRHRDTYIEKCHRKFFFNYARGLAPRMCGQSDTCIGGLAHVGILCAFFGEDVEKARRAVREHVAHTHRSLELIRAAEALARILCALSSGADLRETIFEEASDWISIREAEEWSRDPDDVVIARRFSPACYIAGSFPASLYLAWKYADDFERGVIANTNVGGENCHRGAVVGSLLGAANGLDRIPPRLIDGLQNASALRGRIDALVARLQSSPS